MASLAAQQMRMAMDPMAAAATAAGGGMPCFGMLPAVGLPGGMPGGM